MAPPLPRLLVLLHLPLPVHFCLGRLRALEDRGGLLRSEGSLLVGALVGAVLYALVRILRGPSPAPRIELRTFRRGSGSAFGKHQIERVNELRMQDRVEGACGFR